MDQNNNPTPTQIHYHLKCGVVVKEVTYEDHQSKTISLITEKLVFLIPLEGTQKDMFLTAWLPEVSDQVYEIGIRCGHPIYGVFRGCVKRANNVIAMPHIFVMSKGAEEELKSMVQAGAGQVLEIETLGEHEDEVLDATKDYDLPNKKEYDLISKNAF